MGTTGSIDAIKDAKKRVDEEDDETINQVGKGHKDRKRYKPAIEAK